MSIPDKGAVTHDLLSDGTASGGTNRADKVGAHIAPCIVDVALSRQQAPILPPVVVECERVEPCLLRGPIEPGAPSKHGVILSDIIAQAVMRAARGGTSLLRLTEPLSSAHERFFVNRGHV